MKKLILFISLLIATTYLVAQNTSIPHLQKNGNATQLMVGGKPFLILGGELHNSSTSGAAYMGPIWEQMKNKNLNTVIAPVYWELLEPQQGNFDYSMVDSMVYGARKVNLHLVILWFGSWKNGYSMYAPGWVKGNTEKYARAKNKNGESYQMLSALGSAAMKADANAFKMLMSHIRSIDEKYQTVITVQIENEMGLFYLPREYSDEASKAFISKVPDDLMKYLLTNKGKLQLEIDSAWKANGYKGSGSWEEVFGKSSEPDNKNWKALSYLPEELFTSYHYAKYVGQVAAAGKEAYPIPMYVNAWIKQPGFGSPGRYPAGGPVPHTLDIWRSEAPAIDFISPDIYTTMNVAQYTMEQYHRAGNPLFIPEFKPGIQSANMAFWAYGQLDAICYSLFGIDESKPADDPITKTYAAIEQVKDLVLNNQGKGTMAGIYLDSINTQQSFELNGYSIRAIITGTSALELAYNPNAKKVFAAGGIIIATAPDEFIIVGSDFSLTFTPLKPDISRPLLDVEYTDEGNFVNGKWTATRRLNGDEGTGGGDYGFGFGNNKAALMRFQKPANGDYSIVKFKIYRYK